MAAASCSGGAGASASAALARPGAAAGPGGPAHSAESVFELGKASDWVRVRAILKAADVSPAFPGQCARYVDPTTKRTLLHLAADSGHEKAAGMCVRLGASLDAVDEQGNTAAATAGAKGFAELKELLDKWGPLKSVWRPVADPLLWASSNRWSDRQPKRKARRAFSVAYAGGSVDIPEGGSYYPDSAGRPLVGWSGSYDPPRDMDGEPVFEPQREDS